MLCEAVGAEDSDWNIGQAATRATEVIADLKLTCDRDNARIIAATKNIAAALEGTDHLGLDLEWAVDLVLTELKTLTEDVVVELRHADAEIERLTLEAVKRG